MPKKHGAAHPDGAAKKASIAASSRGCARIALTASVNRIASTMVTLKRSRTINHSLTYSVAHGLREVIAIEQDIRIPELDQRRRAPKIEHRGGAAQVIDRQQRAFGIIDAVQITVR